MAALNFRQEMTAVIDLSQTLKAGSLLIIETGEYSDRSWSDPVRLLKDVVKADIADGYRAAWPSLKEKYDDDDRPDPSGFLLWLVKSGYAEDVANVHSWHIGSYGDFEP